MSGLPVAVSPRAIPSQPRRHRCVSNGELETSGNSYSDYSRWVKRELFDFQLEDRGDLKRKVSDL
jgi:hypothetical protein